MQGKANARTHSQGVNDEELEIDMDIIPDEVLRELYKFLRGTRPKGGAGAAGGADVSDEEYEVPKNRGPKSGAGGGAKRKNKPMGKKEQEESIRQIQRQLESFQKTGGEGDELGLGLGLGSPPLMSARQEESSSDDDGESESEEE